MTQKKEYIDPHKLVSYLKKFMKEYNLNVSEFCRESGISRTAYYEYLKGNPTWKWKVMKMRDTLHGRRDKNNHQKYHFRAEKIF